MHYNHNFFLCVRKFLGVIFFGSDVQDFTKLIDLLLCCEQFLSLLNSDAAFNCEIIRDCYEAFALYCFERYLIACLGMYSPLTHWI